MSAGHPALCGQTEGEAVDPRGRADGEPAGSPIADIASRLDPSIKVIISGPTHAEYRCTSTTNGVTRVPDPSKEDPKVQAVVNQYVTASAPLANRVIGSIQGDLTRTGSPRAASPPSAT